MVSNIVSPLYVTLSFAHNSNTFGFNKCFKELDLASRKKTQFF